MKHITAYCRRHSWCGDLKVAALFLILSAIVAFVVIQAFPTPVIGP
ncbi:hypothetical protein [Shimia sagamensis]|uniref:Uncharacterized protein n=1 Tax=Shimia sagamensis TaxID=1566352 RepID=A0ABY1PCX4_9RHOB|nr:hypothetical protein [Shimia sagamensis]SMP30709.1 hypothetical protein SAMN06265373_107119 [Shimia sagamensis]